MFEIERRERMEGGAGGGGYSFEIGRPSSRGVRILDVNEQEGGGSWKLGNFHGPHMRKDSIIEALKPENLKLQQKVEI